MFLLGTCPNLNHAAGTFTICLRSMRLPFEPALCKLIYIYVYLHQSRKYVYCIWMLYIYARYKYVCTNNKLLLHLNHISQNSRRLYMCSISPVFAFSLSFSCWSVFGKAININKQRSLYLPTQTMHYNKGKSLNLNLRFVFVWFPTHGLYNDPWQKAKP